MTLIYRAKSQTIPPDSVSNLSANLDDLLSIKSIKNPIKDKLKIIVKMRIFLTFWSPILQNAVQFGNIILT